MFMFSWNSLEICKGIKDDVAEFALTGTAPALRSRRCGHLGATRGSVGPEEFLGMMTATGPR